MPTIKVPAVLADGGSSTTVEVSGSTVGEALDAHAEEHGPELRDSVVEDGEIKEFINVYVDGDPVDRLDGVDTALDEDGRVRIIPAASGGARRRPTPAGPVGRTATEREATNRPD